MRRAEGSAEMSTDVVTRAPAASRKPITSNISPVPAGRVSLSLTYGFVDIVAQAKTGAYTPATADGEAPTQFPYRRKRGAAAVRSPADRMKTLNGRPGYT